MSTISEEEYEQLADVADKISADAWAALQGQELSLAGWAAFVVFGIRTIWRRWR